MKRLVISVGVLATLAVAAIVFTTPRMQWRDVPLPEDLETRPSVLAMTIEEAARALADSPHDVAAWERLAWIYHANDLPLLAEECYLEAIALDERHFGVRYARAMLTAEQGGTMRAIRLMGEALFLDGTYAPALFHQGRWYLRIGLASNAERHFREATEADPSHPGGWVGLAEVLIAAGDYQAAVAIIDDHLIDGPWDGPARDLRRRAVADPDGESAEPFAWPDPRRRLIDAWRR